MQLSWPATQVDWMVSSVSSQVNVPATLRILKKINIWRKISLYIKNIAMYKKYHDMSKNSIFFRRYDTIWYINIEKNSISGFQFRYDIDTISNKILRRWYRYRYF